MLISVLFVKIFEEKWRKILDFAEVVGLTVIICPVREL